MNAITNTTTDMEVVNKINELQKKIAVNNASTLSNAMEMGAMAAQQKKKLKHGEWGPWVAENLTAGKSMIEKCVKLDLHRELILKAECVPHLTINQALAYIRKQTQTEPVMKKLNQHQQAIQDLMDGNPIKKKTGTHARAAEIIKHAPTCIDAIMDNKQSFQEAYEEAIFYKKKRPDDEQIQELTSALALIVEPHLLTNLSLRSREWLAKDCVEINAVIESLNKALSKKALTMIIKLFKYHESVFDNTIVEKLPAEIKLYKARLEEKEAVIAEKERNLIKRSEALSKHMSDKDIRLIKGCLHPDKALEGSKTKHTKAFAAFVDAIGE